MTPEEKKQYENELKEFKKNGYIKTTKDNYEDLDFNNVGGKIPRKKGNSNVDKKKVKSTVNIKKVKK
jgi:hypothetical protein